MLGANFLDWGKQTAEAKCRLMRGVSWFLFRNDETHCRTGKDLVSRVGHFKKNLVSARGQSDQDNRVFTGVRPCTFPVVDGHVKVPEAG